MATINATMSLSSDVTEYGFGITKTMTMKKAGSTTGLELTTGLARRTFTAANHVDLLVAGSGIAADVTASKSAKVYIKNVGSSSTDYFKVGIGKASTGSSEEGFDMADSSEKYTQLGRLYGGDWMLIPWQADSTNGFGDITVMPSVATTMSLEYMVFFE